MCDNGSPSVLLDCGSSLSKVGFSSSYEPKAIVKTVIGISKRLGSYAKEKKTGDDAWLNREEWRLKRPVEFGIVTDWDSMEQVYEHLIGDILKVNSEENPFVVTQPALTPLANQEKLIQMFFETFNVPSLNVMKSAEASAIGADKQTAVVADVGDMRSHPVSVVGGYTLEHTCHKSLVEGTILDDALMKVLRDSNKIPEEYNRLEYEKIREIKEQYCYVALDYENELKTFSFQQEKECTLFDKKVTIGVERFKCPEVLFNPLLAGIEMPGYHETVTQCIEHNVYETFDFELKAELYSNILLCGGCSKIPGFAPRLEEEIRKIVDPTIQVRVICPGYDNLAFRGMAIMASNPDNNVRFFTKDFYYEYGPHIIRRYSL